MDNQKKIRTPFLRRIIKWLTILISFVVVAYLMGASAGFLLKKYLIDHSEEWTGRKIGIGSIFIDPFKFSLKITDFKLFEFKSDSVFFSFDELYINARAYPLLYKKIEVEQVILEVPDLYIGMQGESFNFDDLVARFSTADSTKSKTSEGFAYSYLIEEIGLTAGSVRFYNPTFHGGLTTEKINVSIHDVSSGSSSVRGTVDLAVSTGGELRSIFDINVDSLKYNLHLTGKSFDIGFILPFLDKVMYVSSVKGKVDADLRLGGRFNFPVSEAKGFLRLGEFLLLDTLQQPAASLDQFEIQFDTVSAVKGDYVIRHVLIDHPYLKFDLTPSGYNLVHYFPEEDSLTAGGMHPDTLQKNTIEDQYINFFTLLNKYFIDLGQAYAVNYYAIDSLQISRGNIEFGDYTLDKPFNFLFEDLSLQASRLYSDQDSLKINMQSKLNRSGILDASLVLMPKDTGDLKLKYSIDELKVTDFSPYSEYYLAHPFWDGIIFFTSATTIAKSQLDSKNHLLIKHLEVGDKVASKTSINLPLKLAVSLLKDVHGDVKLTIPVKGSINDPKFRLFPIAMKILRDLIVKAAVAPYKLLARTFNASEDELRDIKYDYLQFEIKNRQAKPINMLARVLNQKKGLQAELIHMNNPDWEKNQYALFEVKRRFYSEATGKPQLTSEDSIAIDQISRADSSFVQFVKDKTGIEIFTDVEAACVALVGQEQIATLLDEMKKKRVAYLNQRLSEKVEMPGRFLIKEGEQKEKEIYRERPKFLIRFGPMSDSIPKPAIP